MSCAIRQTPSHRRENVKRLSDVRQHGYDQADRTKQQKHRSRTWLVHNPLVTATGALEETA
jgi:hypothetical protein